MKVGDLVKMKNGWSPPGLVVGIKHTNLGEWLRVLWGDGERSLQARRELEILPEVLNHEIEEMACTLAEP